MGRRELTRKLIRNWRIAQFARMAAMTAAVCLRKSHYKYIISNSRPTFIGRWTNLMMHGDKNCKYRKNGNNADYSCWFNFSNLPTSVEGCSREQYMSYAMVRLNPPSYLQNGIVCQLQMCFVCAVEKHP